MKFRNPKTGEVYDFTARDCATSGFCREISCAKCLIRKHRGEMGCSDYVLSHPYSAARLMGYEVVEDDGGCHDEDHPGAPGERGIMPGEAKADGGKPRPTLVPPSLMEAVTAIREYGCSKYHDPDNWRHVEPQRYRDAAYRHWLAYLKDQHSVDEESGLPHIWHLACNIAFLIELENKP